MKHNLKVLCKLAEELGANNTTAFCTEGIIVDERVRLKCQVPVCDDYGLNLMCPPNVINVQEFRKVLAKYELVILIQIQAPIPESMVKELNQAYDVAALYKNSRFIESYKKSFNPAKLKLHGIINKVEAQAFTARAHAKEPN